MNIDRLRAAIKALLDEDLDTIGEPTEWTAEIVAAFNEVYPGWVIKI